jgi:thermitase
VRRLPLLIGLLALLLACLPSAAAFAAGPDDVQALAGQGVRDIIVARDPGLDAAARGDLRAGAGVAHVEDLPLADTEVVRAPAGGLAAALDALKAEPGVRYAEPNGPVHAATNDQFSSALWALPVIGAPQTWAAGTTGAGQVVGVVDSGLLATHEDLQGAVWTNPGEAGAKAHNHLDDDGDGAVDDVNGWNALTGTTNTTDGDGHGTHVAGTIAARANNTVGVAGVAPGAQVFPLVALDATGNGTDASIAAAFDVAGRLGLPIVNASLQAAASTTVENVVRKYPSTLFVLAAGNGGANDDLPTTPSLCHLPEANIICVGASDQNDARASFSNFGAATVDLFAPGVSIPSTEIDPVCAGVTPAPPPNACYALLDGTSQAAPHVSGTLALMRAANPALGAAELKARLLASVAHPAALAGTSVAGGRLDAAAAVAAVTGAAPAPAPSPAASAAAPPPPASTPPPAPPAPPVTTVTAARVPPAGVVAAPALGRPVLSSSRLTAGRPVTIRFALDRAATVRLTVFRGSRRITTVTIHGRKGANRYVLRTRLGSRRLARGRYRVKVQARAGGAASRTYTLVVRVR